MQERDVPIRTIWLYPIRGVHGVQVAQAEITPGGLRYDRNWVIIGKSKMKPLANHNNSIVTFFRIRIVNTEGGLYCKLGGTPATLTLSLQDDKCFPDMKQRSITLDFQKDYTGCELVQANKGYRGYLESEEVNAWLSSIFEEEVLLLRAEAGRLNAPSDYLDSQLESDRRSAFVTDAAIHVVNQ